MNKHETVRSQMLPMLLGHAVARGFDVSTVSREFELPDDASAQWELEVPLEVMQEMPNALARLCRDWSFGLAAGGSLERGAYGVCEYMWRNAPTLREMFRRMGHYSALLDDIITCSFVVEASEATAELRIPGAPACFGGQGNQFAMAVLVRMLQDCLPGWRPRRIWFAHSAPARSEIHQLAAFFGTSDLGFGCGSNGLAAAVEEADRPFANADATLLAILDDHAQRLIEGQQRCDDFWICLRDRVRKALREGVPKLEDVARSFAMSARTLQRRLEHHNSGFIDVVDEVRRDTSFVYLSDRNLSLGDIADRLSYSDAGTFIRAFKRWTGMTPKNWREQHGAMA